MKLVLTIQVYNGGDYWRRCWESVKANLDLFDHVFISISKSPVQASDIGLVRESRSDKVHLLVHECGMTAVEHGRRFDEWVASFDPEGFIFSLCHDDILFREGLLELHRLPLCENDAVFGSWKFFRDGREDRTVTERAFRRPDGTPISGAFLSFMQYQQMFLFNVSGIVIPASLFRARWFPWQQMIRGGHAEPCRVCSPMIGRIFQLQSPAVGIRLRSESEGALLEHFQNQFDTILYLSLAFAVHKDHWLRLFAARSVGNAISSCGFRGIIAFLRVQFRLAPLPGIYPSLLKIYGYFFLVVVDKVRYWFFRSGEGGIGK